MKESLLSKYELEKKRQNIRKQDVKIWNVFPSFVFCWGSRHYMVFHCLVWERREIEILLFSPRFETVSHCKEGLHEKIWNSTKAFEEKILSLSIIPNNYADSKQFLKSKYPPQSSILMILRVTRPNQMNFRKKIQRGDGHFQSKNLYWKFWTSIEGFFRTFSKKMQYNFPKIRGGGWRPFRIFPKIHLIW